MVNGVKMLSFEKKIKVKETKKEVTCNFILNYYTKMI